MLRKLFKGGNYSRAETIRGNTVNSFWIKRYQKVMLLTLMTLICRQRKYHHIADCPMSSSSHFCFRLVNEIDELNECTCVWHETAHHDQFLKFLSENSQFQAFKIKKKWDFLIRCDEDLSIFYQLKPWQISSHLLWLFRDLHSKTYALFMS